MLVSHMPATSSQFVTDHRTATSQMHQAETTDATSSVGLSYGWDTAAHQPPAHRAHYSTQKNLRITQQNCRRRLRQTLLKSTTTQFATKKQPAVLVLTSDQPPAFKSQDARRPQTTGLSNFVDQSKIQYAMFQTEVHDAYQQPLLDGDGMPLKYNLPYSLAPVPAHLQEPQRSKSLNTRPAIVQRKNVHSYFKPSLPDVVRELTKQGISKHLNYKNHPNLKEQPKGSQPGVIPQEALFAALDTQWKELKEWRESIKPKKCTFGSS